MNEHATVMRDGLKVPLTQGQFALVNEEDWAKLAHRKWHAQRQNKGWAARTFLKTDWSTGRRRYLYASMQEMIMGTRPGFEIDHRNRNTLDNRRENLRWLSPSHNMVNRAYPNSQGFKGVWKNGKRFSAAIRPPRGTKIHLGTFDTPEEAHQVYCASAKKFWGEFASFDCKQGKRKRNL